MEARINPYCDGPASADSDSYTGRHPTLEERICCFVTESYIGEYSEDRVSWASSIHCPDHMAGPDVGCPRPSDPECVIFEFMFRRTAYCTNAVVGSNSARNWIYIADDADQSCYRPACRCGRCFSMSAADCCTPVHCIRTCVEAI